MNAPFNRHQFDAAWLPLRPALIHHASRLCHPQDAEDLTQDTYLFALQILERYDTATGQAGLLRWLLSILGYLCREHHRALLARNEQLLPYDLLHEVADAVTEAHAVEEWPGEVRRLRLLLRAVSLTARQRACFNAWRQGLTQTEIAARLGISQPAVVYHLSAAITRLRAHRHSLVGAPDGYSSAEQMFAEHARVARYRRPPRRGSTRSRPKTP